MSSQSSPLHVLYLQQWFSVNGTGSLLGPRLFDAFKEAADECLLAHCVVDELPDPLDPRLGTDLITVDTVRRLHPNVIYLERGIFTPDGKWRIPRPLAEELVREGAVLIAADMDGNRLSDQAQLYRDVLAWFHTSASGIESGDPVRLFDEKSNAGGPFEVVCHPERMIAVEWLTPVYEGIERIVAGAPVRLDAVFADVLASGDSGSVKVEDEFGGALDPGIFATAYKQGDGYLVLIAGGVTSDVWARVAPDNTRWLVNTASFLARAAQRNRSRKHFLTSPSTIFLSHRSVDKALVAEVSRALQRSAINTWLDRDEVIAGDAFVQEIERGLKTMTAFALFWSASCVGAEWVTFELEKAVTLLKSTHVPIFVVRLDETAVPDSVSHLNRIEAEDMTADEIATTIAQAIERRARRDRARNAS